VKSFALSTRSMGASSGQRASNREYAGETQSVRSVQSGRCGHRAAPTAHVPEIEREASPPRAPPPCPLALPLPPAIKCGDYTIPTGRVRKPLGPQTQGSAAATHAVLYTS
jgi:hypothetical protein